MFYSRPNLPRLNLDLEPSTVAGYLGRYGSVFNVTTVAGVPLQISYKGGRLLLLEKTDQKTEPRVLADVFLGPSYNKTICIEQVGDLLGLTSGGTRLHLPEEKRRELAEHALILDFSGTTSYFERQLYGTDSDRDGFIESFRTRFPSTRLLRPVWTDTFNRGLEEVMTTADCKDGVIFGVGEKAGSLSHLLAKKHVPLFEIGDSFLHVVHFTLRSDIFLAREHNRPIPEYPDVTFPDYIGGRIAAQFKNNHPTDDAFKSDLLELIASKFTNQLATFDLVTGHLVDELQSPIWTSASLASWCQVAAKRFLYATKEDASGNRGHFGRKPVQMSS